MTTRIDATALDDAVLLALRKRPHSATYVIRNVLMMRLGEPPRWTGPPLATRHVLTSCKRLERAGAVRRVPSPYAVMLVWELVP